MEGKHWKGFLDSVMQNSKKRKLVLLAGAVLIGIIFLSTFWGGKEDRKEKTQPVSQISEETYVAQLEDKVKNLLSGIDGVGTPQVMLTLESSSEYVYQSETKRSSDQTGESGTAVQQREDSEQTIVMVEGDNGEKQALIRTELPPKVQGIVVVCDGADRIEVQAQIVDVLTTAFGISSARVSVAKAASSGG